MGVIAILLAGAAAAHALARLLGMPVIPFLLITGAVLRNAGALASEQLNQPLLLGVVFLMFVAGTELNPERVGAQRGAALRVGIAQFFLLGVAGFAAAGVAGFDTWSSLYMALALTASSTIVVVRLLQRRQQMFEPLGRLVIGVLLLQDVLVIALVPVVAEAANGFAIVMRQLGATLLLAGLAWVGIRWAGRRLVALRDDDESTLLVTLALLFVFLGTADALRVPLVSAAFFAGVALSRFPVSGLVRRPLESITDFFAAVFFTALGGFVRLPGPAELMLAIAFALLVVTFTPPIVAVVAERAGFTARPALEGGLLLSQTSELSLVVALQGVLAGRLGDSAFTVIALTTVLTMLFTPTLSSSVMLRRLLRAHPMRRQGRPPRPFRDHIVLVGCGDAGMPLLETLLAGDHDVVVIDDDPAIVSRIRQGGIDAIRGDALDPAVLREAAVADARIVSSTVRRAADNEALLAATDAPVLVRVFDDAEADWVRSHGGEPVVAADAASVAFFRWYGKTIDRGRPSGGAADRGSAERSGGTA